MKKKRITLFVSFAMTLSMGITSFAAGWQKDTAGWWWDNGDGTWPAHSWQWLDGNYDGTSECYCFDGNGYLLTDTTTPDGYIVNADGAWTIDGAVQTQTSSQTSSTSDFPVLNGLYHDTNWDFYYRLNTQSDGSLCLYVSDSSGSQGELYMTLTYIGDGQWTDDPSTDSMIASRAWLIDTGVHVSVGGYVQLGLSRIGD